jgi:hypothetical protein
MESYYAVIRRRDRKIEALFFDEDEAVAWLRRAEQRSKDDFEVRQTSVIFGFKPVDGTSNG